ncbi:hypothetical protein [Flagellimonas crocea]|uniref:hypothetical protein n=1 Tax=Flagellimonas crocea TaxID=3067311 RepID=UPI00296E7901|nr:hypothetical protein [Muricauda sp. DH64]
MNDGAMVLNQDILWPVVLIGLLLWAVFIWKEWSQRKEKRFWVKLVASFLAISALAMIILKPSTWQESTKGKGIIVTEGYLPAQLDSLKSIYKRIPTEEYTKGKTLTILKEADSLFVLGHGLATFDLWQLNHRSVAFLGGENITGWTVISIKDELVLGETLEVNAKYSHPRVGHWAVLADNSGNPLDSVLFEGVEEQLVTLSTNPKASGRFVYHLLEKNENGILSDEPIPVQVAKGGPLKILMVNTFPTFETKYLKNFLTERGHEVLARTQLTTDKYKFEYFNGATSPIYGFTADNLKDYDLLIIDTDSYVGLGKASKEAMEEVVASNGLGVFVQPNESLFRLAKSRSPFVFEQDFVTEVVLGAAAQSLQKYPYTFQESVRTQEIMVDSVKMAAYLPKEKGKVGTTLLQNTYQLVLDGDQTLYARIWTQILNGIAKEKTSEIKWQGITQTPRPDTPFEFELRTSLDNIDILTTEGANIPLLQNGLVPHKWTGTQYPRKTGWNQLKTSMDSLAPFSYYVYGQDELSSILKAETFQANYNKFGSQKTFADAVSMAEKELKSISPYWFYAVLLLCLGWLWLEPKLVQ